MMFILVRISYGFNKLSPTNLVAFVRNVVVMMTGNENFLIPLAALADITTAVNTLVGLIQKAMSGDRIMIAMRDAAQVNLIMLVRNLAAYVQANCQNSLSILLTSGFNAVRSKSPVTLPNTPINARLSRHPSAAA